MKRGEVWWTDLPKPLGRRPVVLLSRDEAYRVRSAVTVAEITTTVRNIPVEVPLGREDGLPKACVANLDTIITISKDLLKERLCVLNSDKIEAVDNSIKFALDLD
ncbi:MAG: type II toxin-antitoxin system PemK/MazF family toxin [Candidatus Omnitrophota bacterium]